MFPWFFHIVACVQTSFFLWLNNIPLFVHTTFCLYIHLLMDICVVFSSWLLWIMLQWKSVFNYLFEFLFNVLLRIYLRVELLYNLAILVAFWGTAKLFYTETDPFYITTSNVLGLQFLHVFSNTCYFLGLKFIVAVILVDMKWYLIAVLICVFLIKDIIYLFLCFLAIFISSLGKYLFKSFAHFKNWVLSLFIRLYKLFTYSG